MPSPAVPDRYSPAPEATITVGPSGRDSLGHPPLTPWPRYAAFRVAKSLWPEEVVGEEAMYVRKVREVWPVLADPHDAVLLVRLLSEEGAIGGRRCAASAGPLAPASAHPA